MKFEERRENLRCVNIKTDDLELRPKERCVERFHGESGVGVGNSEGDLNTSSAKRYCEEERSRGRREYVKYQCS